MIILLIFYGQVTMPPPSKTAAIEGAPNIAATPTTTVKIRPQDTLPLKKPTERPIKQRATTALPPLPVVILMTKHIASVRALLPV